MKESIGLMMVMMVFILSGCSTLKKDFPLDVDMTAQSFFNELQRNNTQAAYSLLGKGLSQRISYDQFDQFMQTIKEQWGRVETDDTALLPFHRRVGEQNFIPLHVTPEQIKRYTFDVKFQNAEMNFDLTLAPDGKDYKIVWFSIWGSSNYANAKIQEKMEELFSNSDDSAH